MAYGKDSYTKRGRPSKAAKAAIRNNPKKRKAALKRKKAKGPRKKAK